MATEKQQVRLDESFERMFERYYRPVSYYFARRGFSKDESNDLAQETFLRAYKRWEHYRQDNETEKAWLFTIAANLYRNTLRKRSATKRQATKRSLSELLEVGIDPPDEEEDPVERLHERQQREELVGAIDDLPPRMRQCFLFRFQQGRKYKDIAQIMQISIQSVKSQLHQAKHRLRQILEGPEDPPN